MKLNRIVVIFAFVLSLTLIGCATYFKVIDPDSNKVYYTDNIKEQKTSSTIQFKDANTGRNVTLPTSQVEVISKEEFKANIHKK